MECIEINARFIAVLETSGVILLLCISFYASCILCASLACKIAVMRVVGDWFIQYVYISLFSGISESL